MTQDPKCPDCGASLTREQAEAGVCPRCAMRLALTDATAATEPGTPADGPMEVPETIGPYRVIRPLGEGGMGVVYLAEQHEPIRREVAVKVIKHGMDTKHVVARFEAERQAMALMDHASIAQVFEAGTTAEGRPYFVMEYVQGEPITAYADRWRLTLSERLNLFARVCSGVQHAHQKGVIHRDLKPSNVLVVKQADEALPKIIDFGVAKATSQRLTEQTLFTELGIMIGTPEYMSPEQAEVSALDVDTRSDVYSLGVLLYELLTGVLPFDAVELRRAGHDEIRRRIREEEPALPSSRVSTLGDEARNAARTRRVDPPSLSRILRGDLDWIVLKTLAKEPERRYGSAAELAHDLQRYLADEPVVARPPSAVYKTRKFVRRHRLLVGSAAVVLVTLLAGIVGTTTFGLREARQRLATDAALADLQEVIDFQHGMISDIDPQAMGVRLAERLRERIPDDEAAAEFDRSLRQVNLTDAALDLLDEEILGRATDEAGRRFADRPEVERELRKSLGDTYYTIGLLDRALAEYERHHELAAGDGPESANDLGRIYWKTGRSADAEPLLLEALDAARKRYGEEHVSIAGAMTNLGLVAESLGRADEAIEWHTKALDMFRATVGPDDMRVLQATGSLASAYQSIDLRNDGEHFDRAVELYAEAVELGERVFGAEHPQTISVLANYGVALQLKGRLAESIEIGERVLDHTRRSLGATHYDTLSHMINVAGRYDAKGDFESSEDLYREALSLALERYGETNRYTAECQKELSKFYMRRGRMDEGLELAERAALTLPRVYGAGHPVNLLHLSMLRMTYDDLDPTPERRAARRRVQERMVDAYGEEGAGHGVPPRWLNSDAWNIMFHFDEDLRDYDVALKILLLTNEMTGFQNHAYLDSLAFAQQLSGDPAAAVETAKKAIALVPDDLPDAKADYEANLARFQAALQEEAGD